MKAPNYKVQATITRGVPYEVLSDGLIVCNYSSYGNGAVPELFIDGIRIASGTASGNSQSYVYFNINLVLPVKKGDIVLLTVPTNPANEMGMCQFVSYD